MTDDALGIGDEEDIGEGIEQAVAFAAGRGQRAQVLGVLALFRVAQAADEPALSKRPAQQAEDGKAEADGEGIHGGAAARDT